MLDTALRWMLIRYFVQLNPDGWDDDGIERYQVNVVDADEVYISIYL